LSIKSYEVVIYLFFSGGYFDIIRHFTQFHRAV